MKSEVIDFKSRSVVNDRSSEGKQGSKKKEKRELHDDCLESYPAARSILDRSFFIAATSRTKGEPGGGYNRPSCARELNGFYRARHLPRSSPKLNSLCTVPR